MRLTQEELVRIKEVPYAISLTEADDERRQRAEEHRLSLIALIALYEEAGDAASPTFPDVDAELTFELKKYPHGVVRGHWLYKAVIDREELITVRSRVCHLDLSPPQ